MSESVNKLFVRRFEPKSLNAFVLPNRIRSIFKDEVIDQNYLYYGSAGIGKSSLAKFLGKKYVFLYVNASLNGKIDYLRDVITEFCENCPLVFDPNINADQKVVLLDEIDGISSAAFFDALRGFMDSYQNVRFMATCNHFEKIPDPIKSRFTCINFEYLNKEEEQEVFTNYLRRVGKIIEVIGKTASEDNLRKIGEKYFPDFRKTLNFLQSLDKQESIEITDKDLQGYECRYEPLYELIAKGKSQPEDIHKILSLDYINSAYEVIVSLDNEFIDYLKKTTNTTNQNIPMICITVANHLNMMANAVDQGIVLKSCVFTLMNNLKR